MYVQRKDTPVGGSGRGVGDDSDILTWTESTRLEANLDRHGRSMRENLGMRK